MRTIGYGLGPKSAAYTVCAARALPVIAVAFSASAAASAAQPVPPVTNYWQ